MTFYGPNFFFGTGAEIAVIKDGKSKNGASGAAYHFGIEDRIVKMFTLKFSIFLKQRPSANRSFFPKYDIIYNRISLGNSEKLFLEICVMVGDFKGSFLHPGGLSSAAV